MFALSHVVAVRGLDLVTKASHLDRGTSCRVVGGQERYCCHMGSTRPHGTHPLIQGRTKQVAVPHFLSSFPGALGQRDSATNLMLGCQPLTACRPPLPPPPALNPTPVYLSPKCNAVGGWTAQRRPASHLRTFTQWRKGGTGAQPDVGRIVGGGDAESPCPLLRRINARRLRRIQLSATRQAVRRPGWSSLLLRPLPKESLHPNGRLTTRLPALGWNHFRVQPCALGLEASWWQPHPLGYRVMDPPTQQA